MQDNRASPEPIPNDVRAESRIVIETKRWVAGVPRTMRAMSWWGAFTDWCVATDANLFTDYADHGPLVIFRSRETSFRWALHPTTGEFRNVRNKRASWSGFLMRNPDVAAGLLKALIELEPTRKVPIRPALEGLASLADFVRCHSAVDPIVVMHLEEVEGAIQRALVYSR